MLLFQNDVEDADGVNVVNSRHGGRVPREGDQNDIQVLEEALSEPVFSPQYTDPVFVIPDLSHWKVQYYLTAQQAQLRMQ